MDSGGRLGIQRLEGNHFQSIADALALWSVSALRLDLGNAYFPLAPARLKKRRQASPRRSQTGPNYLLVSAP
jgi:hypothetical protein